MIGSNMDYKEELKNICIDIMSIFGWDTNTWDDHIKRSIRLYGIELAVYKSMNSLHDYGVGLSRMMNICFGFNNLSEFISYRKPDNFSDESLSYNSSIINVIKRIMFAYNHYMQNDYSDLLQDLFKNPIFKDTNIQDDFFVEPHDLLVDSYDLLVGNNSRFKLYKYYDGGDKILASDKFEIGNIINLSGDMTSYFNHLKNQKHFIKSQDEDKLFVTLFGKLDNINPIYSSWVISIHKGDTIWIATDRVNFDNPHQQKARLNRRSVWREAQELHDTCELPYDIFSNLSNDDEQSDKLTYKKYTEYFLSNLSIDRNDWKSMDYFDRKLHYDNILIDKLRSLGIMYDHIFYNNLQTDRQSKITAEIKCSGILVAYLDGDELVLFHDNSIKMGISELSIRQRLFLIMLSMKIIDHIMITNHILDNIMTSSEFIDKQISSSRSFDPMKTTNMERWDDNNKIVYNEIVETINLIKGDDHSSMIQKDYDQLLDTKNYNGSFMSTHEKLSAYAEWCILEDQKDIILGDINKYISSNKDKDKLELLTMVNSKYHDIKNKLYEYKEDGENSGLFFKNIGYESFSDDGKISLNGAIRNIGGYEFGTIYGTTSLFFGEGGIGKDYRNGDKEKCKHCGRWNSKFIFSLYITHYSQLVWLLDIDDRQKLPVYFRQFRSHIHKPYCGNSILDNVHPYTRISDPASSEFSNGFYMGFYICGNCNHRLRQTAKYGKNIIDLT